MGQHTHTPKTGNPGSTETGRQVRQAKEEGSEGLHSACCCMGEQRDRVGRNFGEMQYVRIDVLPKAKGIPVAEGLKATVKKCAF